MKKIVISIILLGTILFVASSFNNIKATSPTPTKTPTPTPTINPLCVCNTQNTCTSQCRFDKYTGVTGITYPALTKCTVTSPAGLYPTPATAAQKTDWCHRPNRTKGDATGEESVIMTDYFYYVQALYGHKIPASINVDFNGDGIVNAIDRLIIVRRLTTGL